MVVFGILNDKSFNSECLNLRKNRKLKEVLTLISKVKNVEAVQKIVDDFALYRQVTSKEKIGEYHSVTNLFTYFEGLEQFEISIEDPKTCSCGLF